MGRERKIAHELVFWPDLDRSGPADRSGPVRTGYFAAIDSTIKMTKVFFSAELKRRKKS